MLMDVKWRSSLVRQCAAVCWSEDFLCCDREGVGWVGDEAAWPATKRRAFDSKGKRVGEVCQDVQKNVYYWLEDEGSIWLAGGAKEDLLVSKDGPVGEGRLC